VVLAARKSSQHCLANYVLASLHSCRSLLGELLVRVSNNTAHVAEDTSFLYRGDVITKVNRNINIITIDACFRGKQPS
jgi:hypothetical protein